MNAYLVADRREEETLDRLHLLDWKDDLIDEMARHILRDAEKVRVLLDNIQESAKTTQRLAQALRDVYDDHTVISPALVQLKSILYAAAKIHCRELIA